MPVQVPGIQVVDASPVLSSMGGGSTSIVGFVGTAIWGPVGVATLVTSWDEYKRKFGGLSADHDLGYQVWGFFNNGGSVCWVVRTVHYTDVTSAATASGVKASLTLKDSLVADCLTLEAKYAGALGNNVTISIENSSEGIYDLVIKSYGYRVKVYTGLTQATVVSALANSDYIGAVTVVSASIIPEDIADAPLIGGLDGIVGLVANDIIGDSSAENGLHALDKTDIDLIATFEVYSSAVCNAVVAYAESRGDCFAVLDMPEATDIAASITYRGTITSSDYGSVYYPWIAINDPITSAQVYVPVAGFACGGFARNDTARAVWKAPAGLEMYLNGAVGVKYIVDDNKQKLLNPIGVNCIRVKGGIPTIWGSELLDITSQYKNVNGKRLQIFIKKVFKASFDWVTFEPIDEKILGPTGRIEVSGKSWLSTLDTDPRGGPFDHEAGSPFYNVRADFTNNPKATRDEGQVYTDISYFQKGVAKEIIFSVGLGAA